MLLKKTCVGRDAQRDRRDACPTRLRGFPGLLSQRNQFCGCGESVGNPGGVFAAAAGGFRAAAAFAADDRGDGLDDFAGLDFGCEIGRDGGDEADVAIEGAGEQDCAVEL